MSQELPIASLTPAVISPDADIQGVVTLVWPYSQATQTFAILLGAEDFRERSHHGQIRIQFTGPTAKAVAEKKIGITDKLRISLDGARWVDDTDVHTPGKSVAGELAYKNRLQLTVLGDPSRSEEILVDAPEAVRAPPIAITPTKQVLRRLLGPDAAVLPSTDMWRSPSSHQEPRSSLASDPIDLDELLDDDGSRKRSRVSFGKIKDWRMARRSPSPSRESMEVKIDEMDHLAKQGAQEAIRPFPTDKVASENQPTFMKPPALPQLTMPWTADLKTMSMTLPPAPTPLTPTLQPVSGKSLPLPSPFPDGSMQSHFSDHHVSTALPRSSTTLPTTAVDTTGTSVPIAKAAITIDAQPVILPATSQPSALQTTSLSSFGGSPTSVARIPKAVDSSVMASLFGVPATIAVNSQLRPSTNGRTLSDFDLAAMPFTDGTTDADSSRASQDKNSDTINLLEPEAFDQEPRVAPISAQPLLSQENDVFVYRPESTADRDKSRTDDAKPKPTVPAAMLKWSTPRQSLDSLSTIVVKQQLSMLPFGNHTTLTRSDRQEIGGDTLAIGPPTLQTERSSRDRPRTKERDCEVETREVHETGLYTPHAYFSRLRSLDAYLNVSDRSEGRVDIIAAVSNSTRPPKKMESGPRDFFTMLYIKDGTRAEDTQVEVYRPYSKSLPNAEAGDVILLRGFNVQSYEHTPFLRSTDASSWCVWRFAHTDTSANKPQEEVRGPPVEYGPEECSEARRLQAWYVFTEQRRL